MKYKITITMLICALALFTAEASTGGSSKNKRKKDVRLLREIPVLSDPNFNNEREQVEDSSTTDEAPAFKPSVQVGSIVHMFGSAEQIGFGPGGSPTSSESDTWAKGFSLYRARVLVGGQLSKNGTFFLETDLPSPVGIQNGDSTKNVKVAPIILDAQYEHMWAKDQMVVVGKQLVSHNRNGLQGAAGLMANDFTYFQYPYNLFENSPLQGNFGRDLGVNLRGFLASEKLEYRFGVFTGRNLNADSPLRIVGRAAYNFLDKEKDYYYAGTKLGSGKTVALAAGFDVQGTYSNFGADLYVDLPVGENGAITLNAAFSAMSGGTDTAASLSFATLIPRQTTQFLELGYYIKSLKLQPWIRYERQAVNADGAIQTGGIETGIFNDLSSTTVFGGGLNYWFAGYNTNLRLSYTTWTADVMKEDLSGTESKTHGQIWMQLQFFIF